MKVAFRVDASLRIGSGHVMRCLTLAESLRLEGHECLFISREHKGHLGGLISQCGFGLHLLYSAPGTSNHSERLDLEEAYSDWLGVSQSQDARETGDVLATDGVDWLVVDHYALDACWEQEVITAGVAKHILAIDDLANRKHISRLLLDQNLGREIDAYDFLLPENCTRLIGPSYALLREEFTNWRELSLERRKAPKLRRILISLGGVDKDNVTGLVLEALAEGSSLSHKLELDIVMGGGAPYLDQVRQQALELPFRAEVNINVTNMAERMCKADLAIGAAGGTAWERCCLGLPTVLLILAENQASGARALERCGAACVIERCEGVARNLPQLLKDLSKPENLGAMAEMSAGVTDGFGTSRVVKCMSRISGESHA